MRIFAVSFTQRAEPIRVEAPNAKCALEKALRKARQGHAESRCLGWQLHHVTGIELESETDR